MILTDILIDGFWGAIAAIGFGAISDPPTRAFKFIAILGALGHASRYFLMNFFAFDISSASFIAGLIIGFSSLWLGAKIYCPTTVLYIPALLPMIPGKFAYNTVFSLIMYLQNMQNAELKTHYKDMIFDNGIITFTVIFLLAIGATIPMFVFNKKAYSLTRRKLSSEN